MNRVTAVLCVMLDLALLAPGGLAQRDPGQAAGACIPPAQQAQVRAAIERARLHIPPCAPADSMGVPPDYEFWPQAGWPGEDRYTLNYVDLDATAAALSYRCDSVYTYDGHEGIDALVRSFGEQLIGVPVFAAHDGVILVAEDGHPDMNVVSVVGQPVNYVIIDPGTGLLSGYFHLKLGSVAVAPGQVVVAGQQIGMTASSGQSDWPHLHFQTGVAPGVGTVEPFAGPCNPDPHPSWTDQEPTLTATFAWDFGFSREPLAGIIPPFAFPRSGHVALTDPSEYHWVFLGNLPPNSVLEHKYFRPDGTLGLDDGPIAVGNASFKRLYWNWWSKPVASTFQGLTGTWRYELHVNGVKLVDAPLEITATHDPAFNRAPESIGLARLPADAAAGDVLRVHVLGDTLLDDLDYDIVRYRYAWVVDGVTVRDVISAGRLDMQPALANGGLVELAVTPSDGVADGATESLRFGVQGQAFTDLGFALAGTHGEPVLVGEGDLSGGSSLRIALGGALELTPASLLVGLSALNVPFKGGVLVPDFQAPGLLVPLFTNAQGRVILNATWPLGLPSGLDVYLQYWVLDSAGPAGFAASNAVRGTTP
jgi:hypothetical protein